MATSHQLQQSLTLNNQNNEDKVDDLYKETYQKFKDVLPTLPEEKGWWGQFLVNYQGIWFTPPGLLRVMLVQNHFQAQSTDILLATPPKSGTTWFKALLFAVINRDHFDIAHHLLLTKSPHDCILYLEEYFTDKTHHNSLSKSSFGSPRDHLFSTHLPYPLLPPSVVASGCQIVYVFRNPKDVLISSWHFYNKIRPQELAPLSLQEVLDLFCKGALLFGHYWDHAIGYWNAHLKYPNKVLVLTYEGMKREPWGCIKKLAEFLNRPFSQEEERGGVVEEILKLCSFESLSNLEVTKKGSRQFFPETAAVGNDIFFRKGEIGDWQNHLTAEMIERLDQITELKFGGTGLMDHISN